MFYLVYCTLGILASYGQIVFSNPIAYDQRQTGDVNVQIHLKDVQVVALLDSGLLEDYVDYDYAYDYADFTLKPIVKPTTSTPPVSSSSVKPWNTWPTKPSSSTTTKSSNAVTENSKLNTTEHEETTISVNSDKATASVNEEKTTISSNGEKTTVAPNEEKSTISSSEEKTTISSSEEISTISPSVETSTISLSEEKTTIPPNTQESSQDPQSESSKINKTDGTTLSLRINIKNDNELNSSEEDNKKVVEATTNEPQKKSCPSQYILDKKGRCRSIKSRRRVSLVPLAMRLGTRLAEKGNFGVRKDLPIRVYKSEPSQ